MWQKFLDEANGDPVRAEHLRKAFFGRMALKSARARRKIKEARAELVAVEAEIDAAGGDVASSIWAAENAYLSASLAASRFSSGVLALTRWIVESSEMALMAHTLRFDATSSTNFCAASAVLVRPKSTSVS
jgi:inorganic triphosphatase YgiF